MQNLIDQIDRSFQRLLRWVYPAMLFLVLLHLTRPEDFAKIAQVERPWGLIVGGLVAGAVAYLFQAYVFNQVISHVSTYLGWEINASRPLRFRRALRPLANHADQWAEVTRRRWGTSPERLSSYLDYAWATYHAMMLTGWLTLILFASKVQDSLFASVDSWNIIVPATLLLVAAIWHYAWLSRVQVSP